MATDTLIEMAKAHAISTFTCEHNLDKDYDDFMELKTAQDLISSTFTIWEPFEYVELSELQKLVETEFTTTLALLKKAIQQASRRIQIDPDEFVNWETFHNFVACANGKLYRHGTADEYATVLTVDTEVVR